MNKRENKSTVTDGEALIILFFLSIVIGVMHGVNSSHYHKLEKRVVALEQEIARQDCEKEAQAVGAAYMFIANGTESECYPLYTE